MLKQKNAKMHHMHLLHSRKGEEDLHSSGSADDSDKRGSDVEDMGTSQDE